MTAADFGVGDRVRSVRPDGVVIAGKVTGECDIMAATPGGPSTPGGIAVKLTHAPEADREWIGVEFAFAAHELEHID